MSRFQFQRPNPHKPSVTQQYKGGMWWAKVITAEGNLIVECFFSHSEALARAYELAAMNKESVK